MVLHHQPERSLTLELEHRQDRQARQRVGETQLRRARMVQLTDGHGIVGTWFNGVNMIRSTVRHTIVCAVSQENNHVSTYIPP